jgi:hypothetical protein
MSYYLNHPEFFNRPIRLTEEERNDPLKVVSCFFDDYTLSEIREHNQQIDHICLSTDAAPFQESDERDRLLCYRNDEERALEAAFLLSRKYDPTSKPAPTENSTSKVPHHLIAEIDLTDLQRRLVEIQHRLAQLGVIVAKAYSAGVDQLIQP